MRHDGPARPFTAALRSFAAAGLVSLLHSPAWADQVFIGTKMALPDGRTLVAGRHASDGGGFGYAWMVARFLADGAPDPSFGIGGTASVPIWHYQEFASQLAVLPQGNLLVGGEAIDPSLEVPCEPYATCTCTNRMSVARLAPDGSIDRTFNGNGRVEVAPTIDYDDACPRFARFEVAPDGSITIFGTMYFPFVVPTPLIRLHANGTQDTTFAGPIPMRVYSSARVTVVEAFNAALDHYFITWEPDEIAALDRGSSIRGWSATGKRFAVLPNLADGTSPVCRFYIPPPYGDSHFFGRGEAECNATAAAHPEFVLESSAFMHVALPKQGACPAKTVAIYRVFNNRPDANHRYTTDKAVRDAMVAIGWVAEGDGPDRIAMCAPE